MKSVGKRRLKVIRKARKSAYGKRARAGASNLEADLTQIVELGSVISPIEDLIEDLQPRDERLQHQHVDLWMGLLRFNFNPDKQTCLRCVPIQLTLVILEDIKERNEDVNAQARVRTLRGWLETAKVFLVPLWASGGHGSLGHYTCLRL